MTEAPTRPAETVEMETSEDDRKYWIANPSNPHDLISALCRDIDRLLAALAAEQAKVLHFQREYQDVAGMTDLRAALEAKIKENAWLLELLTASEAARQEMAAALGSKDREFTEWRQDRGKEMDELEAEIARLKARPTNEEEQVSIKTLIEIIECLEAGEQAIEDGKWSDEYFKGHRPDLEKVLALLRRLAAQSDGWRPIAEMPIDNMKPLIFASLTHIAIGYADNPAKEFEYGGPPTHFMPLPSPPSAPSTETIG